MSRIFTDHQSPIYYVQHHTQREREKIGPADSLLVSSIMWPSGVTSLWRHGIDAVSLSLSLSALIFLFLSFPKWRRFWGSFLSLRFPWRNKPNYQNKTSSTQKKVLEIEQKIAHHFQRLIFVPPPPQKKKRKKRKEKRILYGPLRISFSFNHQPFRKLQSPSNGHHNNRARVSPWAFVRLKIQRSLTTRFFREWMREKRKQQRTAVALKVFGSISFALCFSEFYNGCAHVVRPFQRWLCGQLFETFNQRDPIYKRKEGVASIDCVRRKMREKTFDPSFDNSTAAGHDNDV